MSETIDARVIRLLVLDVDGVMTDGGIIIDDEGRETKVFHVRDGFGIRLWQRLGGEAAIITGRSSRVVSHRAAELRIQHVMQGVADKAEALAALLARSGRTARETAAIGDDLNDLPLLAAVGYPLAVADAAPEVRRAARFVTSRPGGRGAVREAIEHLLIAQGRWSEAVGLFAPPGHKEV